MIKTNFHDFINEDVKLPVLDVVIDDDGNVYNGVEMPLIKGNIEQKKIDGKNTLVGIIGIDGKKYPAGIDKNGDLVSVLVDNEGFALNKDNERMDVPIIIRQQIGQRYWRVSETIGRGVGRRTTKFDYSSLIPMLSTGWVNTKIDMEIIKKVRRYARGLGTNDRGHESFMQKLNDMQKVAGPIKYRKRERDALQKEMSGVILLHFINEIKDFFTPSSAGFLFESFLAGLIPNAKVKEDNSKIDVIANDFTYQIKLYSSLESTLPIATLPNGKLLDYYVICLKYPQRIDIYVLNGQDKDIDNHIDHFKTSGGLGKNLSVSELKKVGGAGMNWTISLELVNIDEKIEKIAKGLRQTLDKLYKELSSFQYNIETIVSGVDEKGNIIEDDDFEEIVGNSNNNCSNMMNELNSLVSIMRIPRRPN